MDQHAHPNLDKLRNIVQKLGRHSFTSAQVALEYEDAPASAETAERFDGLLKLHATVLGIVPVPGASGATVWHMAG